jgi:hypothetical protein
MNNKDLITDVFLDYGLYSGRMIGYSKTVYRMEHPDNELYFNANIFTEEDGKIWWGDIDFTLDEEILQKIAELIGKKLYILREMDGRFENENLNVEKMKERAQQIIG